jgi:hypothetical protein
MILTPTRIRAFENAIPRELWAAVLAEAVLKYHPRGNNFLPFAKAREFARGLRLTGARAWRIWCTSGNRPTNIPAFPDTMYKEQFRGWGDWLGTGNVFKKDFRSFESAREFVRGLGLTGMREWRVWLKSGNRPKDIPTSPERVYKEQWQGMDDFLGNQLLSFEKAREYAHGLGLKSFTEWAVWCKSGNRPKNIPSRPDRIYKEQGWVNWGDFLNTSNVQPAKMVFLSFKEARKYVRDLGLKSRTEYRVWSKSDKRPMNIPSNPNLTYTKQGWSGWVNWLWGAGYDD